MNPSDETILVVSEDRLFAEAAARFIQRHTGFTTITERDGVQALIAVARHQPNAVLVLGSVSRMPTEAFARRFTARWPSVRLVVVAPPGPSMPGSLGDDADGDAVLRALAAPAAVSAPTRGEIRPDDVARLRSLTPRERRVLVLLGQGLEHPDIARRLSISDHTVRTHLQNLYRKLDVHSRLDVVRLAAQHGLLDRPAGQTE